jgi:3-methyladenine DNA glycosylase AlkD
MLGAGGPRCAAYDCGVTGQRIAIRVEAALRDGGDPGRAEQEKRPSDIELIERLLRQSRTWALVDGLAASVVGNLVERYPELSETLNRWSIDDDFWIRRSALLALLLPLREGQGDFERFGRYADAMLEEREFFIRKAIGWVLRETPGSVPIWSLNGWRRVPPAPRA